MPQYIDVGGQVIEFPDGMQAGEIESAIKKNRMSIPVTPTVQPKQESSFLGGVGDVLAGGLRGAGSIGATLLSPIDATARALNNGKPVNIGGYDIVGQDRRAGMDSGLTSLGADTQSIPFKSGKLAAEIAGTAGAGGLIANTAKAVAPTLAASRFGAPIIDAIATSGMKAGGLTGLKSVIPRMIGGGITGGVSTGMVNPDDAGTGVAFGAALPPSLMALSKSGQLLRKGGAVVAKNTIGLTTGAGAETFGTAYKAGKDGGTSFIDNMRGNVPMTDVLDSAKDALSKMRVDRGNQYRSGMIDIGNDKAVIDFAPIDKVAQSLKTMGSFKGQVINKNAAGTVDDISGIINQWKNLDPAEFHTPEGLDALKKSIGDIRDATQFGTPGRKAADTAYNAVKAQIEFQAPTYAKVMKDYSQASQAITEIEKSLSLGNKASADTSMRKLQSLMRNNVNTNYGNRLNLARTLEDQGADILPAVAGQSASSITPRGLQGLAASGAGIASLTNPWTLAALPFASPRLMGEAAYGLGAMNRVPSAINRGMGNIISKSPFLSEAIGNSQGGLLGSPQALQQFMYQVAPVALSR
jgi:hypothetical protein